MTDEFVRVRSVKAIGGLRLRLGFTDGSEKVVDVERYLRGPIFERVRNDPEFFASVEVDHELGTIVWPNGADSDPDVLYEGLAPAWETERPKVVRDKE